MITWGAEYELGIPKVDGQHRVLVMLINRLEGLRDSDGAIERDLEEILKHLEEYVRTHFADEERLMKDFGYADTAEHIAEHRNFEDYIAQLRNDFKAGQDDVLEKLSEFLGGWLTHHILEIDQGYVDDFRARSILKEAVAKG